MPTKSGSTFWTYWRPLKFDQYIFVEILGTFIGSTIFTLFVLLMFQMLRLAEILIVHGASGFVLAKMIGFMMLTFLPKAFPLAFLISVLTTFGRLSTDSELIALKAAGISALRQSVPAFVLAAIVVVVSVNLHSKWVPWAEVESKRTLNRIGNTRAISAIKEGTFTSGFFDLLIFAEKVDSKKNRLYHVFIYDEREPQNPMTYIAREAELIPVKTGSDLGAALMLRLLDGSSHQNHLKTQTYEKMEFKVYQLFLQINAGGDGLLQKPEMIPQNELLEIIKKTTTASFEGREMRGEYWKRFAIAFSPLIFVLLGIGFGSFRHRTAKTGAVLTAFIILTFYWTLQMAGTAAVERGTLPPILAMQIPNLTLFIVGLWGFRRASW